MSFNKVDEALRSVGITLQTTDHQFRDFTDVILELADKWDTLDSAAQRYVATQFAGNRQQSRFLALVSNVDLLRQNIANAENSEDVGTLQALKAMDSLKSKLNQVQVAYQQFYTTIGIENVWKGFLDGTKSVIDTLNGLPKVFGVVPINAAAMAYTVISLVKTIVLNGFSSIASSLLQILENSGKQFVIQSEQIGEEGGTAVKIGFDRGANGIGQSLTSKLKNNAGQITTALGSVGVVLGGLIDKGTETGRVFAGISTSLGGAIQTIGGIIQGFQFGWAGAILPIISGVINIINGVSIGFESSAEKLERLTKEAENLNNEAKKAKAEYNTLNRSIDKINELKEKRNESIEATQEYHDAVNELADQFPQLTIGLDDAGNAIINAKNAELLLIEAREKAAQVALDATKAERERNQQEQENKYEEASEILTGYNDFVTTNGSIEAAAKSYGFNNSSVFLASMALSGGNEFGYATPNYNLLTEYQATHSKSALDNFKEYRNLEIIPEEQIDLVNEWIKITELNKEDLKLDENKKRIFKFQEDVQNLIENGDNFWNFLYEAEEGKISQWEELINSLKDIVPLQITDENLRRTEIDQTLRSNQYNDTLLDSTLLKRLTAGYLINTAGEDITVEEYENAVTLISQWWTHLSDEQQQLLDNIYNNLSNYSFTELENILKNNNFSDEIITSFEDVYTTQVTDVTNQIRAQARNFGFMGHKLDEVWESFNSELGLSLLTEAASTVTQAENQGLQNNANELRTLGLQLFESLANFEGNTKDLKSVETILSRGFSTREEIDKAISEIQSLDLGKFGENVTDILKDMQDNIITNYLASLQSSVGSNPEKYVKDKKTINNLTKGMDIDEMYAFINGSINSSLDELDRLDANDFIMDASGAWVVATETMQQFWHDYVDKNYGISEELQEFHDRINSETISDEDIARLGLNVEADGATITERVESFNKYYEEMQHQYEVMSDYATQYALSIGDYTSVLGDISLIDFASAKLDKNDLISREAQTTLNEAYSNLISDVFSKGFENINPDDYTGLISGDNITDWMHSYQEFVDKYVGYTGKTLSEVNELIIQAIEKDQEQTRGVQELAKNITFISPDVAYASLDTIQKLADIFQQDVRQMFDVDSYDELLGGYRITNFDFSQIENAQTMVADSIQKFFEDIAKLISNGLAGKLSSQDRDNLIKQMERYGIEVNDAMFTQTSEGLKLSADAATTLYARLRDVDSLRAQLIFDDLADAFQKAGEECENISTTLAAIARLEADLQKPENANNQLLRDRLALYKDIAKSQTSDPNQFKFMDRDLPNGMQGPENYWNAVGKAYTAMNSAKSSGYMEIQDFYNIVNEMANLVEMSGGRVELMGMNFENAAEMSATLIEQGMSALTNIDGKGVKISMAKLGADFGIGVDDMAKGFDDGIKEMARAQIKMLDAQIALLEAVVAMEGLGDIAGPDMKFDFSELFTVDENGIRYSNEISEWANNLLEDNKNIATALEKVKIGDYTLLQIVEDAKDGLIDLDLSVDQLLAIYQGLLDANISDDYNLDEILTSVSEVLSKTGLSFTVEDSVILGHKHEIVKNEKGEWEVEGKPFKDEQSAIHYAALLDIGVKEGDVLASETVSGQYVGTLNVNNAKIAVVSNEEGVQYYDDAGIPHNSVEEAISANFELYKTTTEDSDKLSREAWEIKQGYKLVLTPAETTEVTAQQAENLKNTTWAEFKAEWESKDNNVYELQAKYGVNWTNTNTEEDFNKLRELTTGVEHRDIELNVTVTSDNDEFVNLLNDTAATKEIILKVTDIDYSGLNSDPTNPNPNTPKINVDGATEGLESIRSIINEITAIDWTNFNTLSDILTTITTQVQAISTAVQTFANQTFTVELNQTGTGTVNIDSTTDTSSIFDLVAALDSAAQGVISNIQKVIDALGSMETTADGLSKLADALTKITETRSKIVTIATTLSTFSSRIDSIRRSLDRIPTGTKSLNVKFNYSTSKSSAKGNVALAKGNQEALAAGTPTLMGELGPELVVSRGHYFVVGQAGAEFVNLDKDAIVFNHKQTKRLLGQGSINSRGVPFTNEANALSFAKGNYPLFGRAKVSDEDPLTSSEQARKESQLETVYRTLTRTVTEKISNVRVSPSSHILPLYSYAKGSARGPAMATASQALAQLKQIRAMWQSMLDASAKELGSLAGGSGGKKGGGGGDDWQQKTTTAEIQRWYNLIRQIARIEEEITYQESLQSKLMSDRVANGKAVYKSYKQELALLQQEIGANQELAALQKSWYDAKRADLAASDYGKIFTYDENGLQQYVGSGAPGTGLGLDILENLTRQDVYGQAIGNAATAQQQLAYLRSVGFNTENLRYNEDGTLIKFEELEGEKLDNAYVQMMENFWSNLDGWRDELDSIYDSYHEQLEKVLSNQDKQNEIFQKIVDNQLSVENDILEAIESREQKRIDDAQDERDALADSADKFIKGLSDQLSKEREMYQRNNDQDDLNKLRRQLAILQRSGGAASQIRSLQDQINSKTQDAYFTAQQDQIDAIKEASDAQLERLDTQIDLMTETLEYQKENGLLWAEVYEVMARTPAEIQDFITNNTPDFQSNSALQVAEDIRDLKLRIEQWTEYRDDVNNGNNPMSTYSNTWDTFYNSQKNLFGNVDSATLTQAKSTYESTLAETGDPNAAAQAADKILNKYRKVNATDISNIAGISGPSAGIYTGSGITGSTGAASANEKVSTIEGMLKKGDKGDDVRKLQAALNKLGYTDGSGNTLAEDGIFGSNTKAALQKFQTDMGIASDGILGPDTKSKFAIKGYRQGGIADYTGLAMLHGSAANPEGILNAGQMKMWKQDMEMREQLLPTLLAIYNSMLQNNSSRSFGTTENTGTVIEHIDLNLNVQELSNDYDARRAADTIMERLMDVSRKSGNLSIKRR